MLGAVVLAVFTVGCTTSQWAADDRDDRYDRSRQTANRIYIDDPYAGVVVLERDPYTGRYYDVTYGNGAYGYDPYYRGRYANPYMRGNRYPTRVTRQQPTEEQRQERQQSREEARKRVLGGN